jgi:hypothetical protein
MMFGSTTAGISTSRPMPAVSSDTTLQACDRGLDPGCAIDPLLCQSLPGKAPAFEDDRGSFGAARMGNLLPIFGKVFPAAVR